MWATVLCFPPGSRDQAELLCFCSIQISKSFYCLTAAWLTGNREKRQGCYISWRVLYYGILIKSALKTFPVVDIAFYFYSQFCSWLKWFPLSWRLKQHYILTSLNSIPKLSLAQCFSTFFFRPKFSKIYFATRKKGRLQFITRCKFNNESLGFKFIPQLHGISIQIMNVKLQQKGQ